MTEAPIFTKEDFLPFSYDLKWNTKQKEIIHSIIVQILDIANEDSAGIDAVSVFLFGILGEKLFDEYTTGDEGKDDGVGYRPQNDDFTELNAWMERHDHIFNEHRIQT